MVDELANKYPDKPAMIHLDKHKVERHFTFKQMKVESRKNGELFQIARHKKGDRVMLVLKRHYQFWFAIVALHKLGAVAIPATSQLQEHDFDYRFNAAGVSAIVCTADGDVAAQVDAATEEQSDACPQILSAATVTAGTDFDTEYKLFSSKFERTEDTACGYDPMLMFFTSGTTGYPKIAQHDYTYALGHYITAKYWHGVHSGRRSLHHFRYGLGQSALGQTLRSMALRGLRFSLTILTVLTRRTFFLFSRSTI